MFFSAPRRYPVGMELQLKPHALTALSAPHAARDEAALLIAKLALRGPVMVLDGGNRFAGYRIMQHLRLHLADPMPAIQRVFVRRAFTCYQVLTMLEELPARSQPTILLDMLSTFYDENVPLEETSRLLECCLRQVSRLTQAGPMLVTLAPPPTSDRLCLVERLSAAAHTFYSAEAPLLPGLQPLLF
jgi:hypothetical protein